VLAVDIMNIKEAYYYIFYRLFRLWRKDENIFLSSQFRAEISLMALEFWFTYSLIFYHSILTKGHNSFIPESIRTILFFVPGVLIVGHNLSVFTFSKKWQLYNEHFDEWPRRKNMIGGIIVWIFIILIIANFFTSAYFYQQVFFGY